MRSKSNRRRRDARKGFTLVEVVIATLLLAIGITASFSVCVSVKFKVNKDDTRTRMNFYARQLLEDLKSYVTADTTDPDLAAGAPYGTWSYCWAQGQCDAAAWALAPGEHVVTMMLPKTLRDDQGATLKYFVGPGPDFDPHHVDIIMNWNTPD